QSTVFDTLPLGVIDRRGGLVQAGGCAAFGEAQLGVDPPWVRVATLKVHALRPGQVRVAIDSAGELRGVSLFGRFGNVDLSQIEFKGLDLELRQQPDRITPRESRLR
ncbi:MAG: hypothetical protein V1790_06545, partial [Planctomycetota bacterium]